MGTSPTNDNYYLARDFQASLRLVAQHWLFTKSTGWLIHPRISAHLSTLPSCRIADLACGSGIWSLEVLDTLPSAEVTALDISASAFPPVWTRLSRIRFGVLDLFDPVPDEYVGQFDMVHLGVLAFALLGRDKDKLISNMVKMLKPGGFLQWRECTPYVLRAEDPPGEASSAFRNPPVFRTLMGEFFKSLNWLMDLPSVLEYHGLVQPESTPIINRPEYLSFWSINAVAGLNEFRGSAERLAQPEVAEKIRSSVEESLHEIEQGRIFAGDLFIAVARKPELTSSV